MKSKILIILIVVLSLGLIAGGIYLSTSSTPKNLTPPTKESYGLNELGRVTTCYNEDCTNQVTDIYAKIEYEYKSEKLQKVIKKINEDTEKNYQEAINSDTSDSSCSSISGYAKNSIRYSNEYHVYTTDEIISIAVKRDKQNICTFTGTSYPLESYFYDIKNDKFLETKEILKLLGYTEDNLKYTITTGLAALAQEMNITINYLDEYKDTALYYTTAGDLYVSFYVNELGYHYAVQLIK